MSKANRSKPFGSWGTTVVRGCLGGNRLVQDGTHQVALLDWSIAVVSPCTVIRIAHPRDWYTSLSEIDASNCLVREFFLSGCACGSCPSSYTLSHTWLWLRRELEAVEVALRRMYWKQLQIDFKFYFISRPTSELTGQRPFASLLRSCS